VGHCPVVEGDVELAVIFHVVVVGAEEAAIAIARQARDVVHAARHAGGADGAAGAGPALDRLPIEAGGGGGAAPSPPPAPAPPAPQTQHRREPAPLRTPPPAHREV